jgi:ribosomal protein S18 acetylase RimI-like enzyme
MTLIVREAQENDISAIQTLAEIVLQEMYSDSTSVKSILKRTFSEQKIEKTLSSENITILLAEVDSEIRGICQFGIPLLEDCDCEDLIEIYRLYIHPKHWESGIGEALIEETESFLNQDAKIRRLSVFVNPSDMKMVRFYAAMGFHHEASEDIDDEWYMEVDI